ncbi:hypothetical protein [Mycolicibacterium septicum]|uniref:hypothetical protein n=1 Tax=Mycolicibacterium septicum TaxID=98668 RepID=UPI001AF04A91|nr:hypothetical protein [Mycolicibacterium septicum]QRY51836.1 hypothetical protein JVX95_31430 [Mycolicibacterium septicum]
MPLPRHEVWPVRGEFYWRVDTSTVVLDQPDMLSVTVCDTWDSDDQGATPDQFRRPASALLTAAAAAEADHV